MKEIKVYGIRKSGTRYLTNIIQNNVDNDLYNVEEAGTTSKFGWKHGKPQYFEDAYYVFIIRGLEEWLSSMWSNPLIGYEPTWKGSNNFKDFVTSSFTLEEGKTPQPPYHFRNIFELYYYKINWYLKFFDGHQNCAVIKLEHLRKDHFLVKTILESFQIIPTTQFEDVIIDTNSKEFGVRTRKSDYKLTKSDKNLIKKFKINRFERRLANLSCLIHI